MSHETKIFPEPKLHRLSVNIRYYVNNDGCFISIAHRHDRDGYPKLRRKGKDWLISRYIYTLIHGAIPAGMVVRHKCDNPSCINPDHLEIGTQADNMQDKKMRGKPQKKLTTEEILFIKSAPDKSVDELAKEFGVAGSTIYKIQRGKSWKEIKSSKHTI